MNERNRKERARLYCSYRFPFLSSNFFPVKVEAVWSLSLMKSKTLLKYTMVRIGTSIPSTPWCPWCIVKGCCYWPNMHLHWETSTLGKWQARNLGEISKHLKRHKVYFKWTVGWIDRPTFLLHRGVNVPIRTTVYLLMHHETFQSRHTVRYRWQNCMIWVIPKVMDKMEWLVKMDILCVRKQ